MDIIQEEGFLALGSRFRRISDQLFAEGVQFLKSQQVDFEPSCFPLFALLARQDEITLTEAAQRIGVTHAGISQKAALMKKHGWVTLKTHADDKRSKHMGLTLKGRELLKSLQPIWYAIRHCQQELASFGGMPFLHMLDHYESQLRSANLQQIMQRYYKQYFADHIVIHSYRPEWRHYFMDLNREWIEHYFSMEPYDEALLSQPESYILDKGGQIFYAELHGDIIGTCAMMPYGTDDFELVKMGVRPDAQGKGVGRKMIARCIDFAIEKSVPRIIILTSDRLLSACTLYRKMGFSDVALSEADLAKYVRVSAKFEMMLRSPMAQTA
jgi:DNA-binding MarR family transcriptional regulator/GNAT superfamily N-acetyltransferase